MLGNFIGPLLEPLFAILPVILMLFTKVTKWKTKIKWFIIILIIPWLLKFITVKFHYYILGYEWSSSITIVWCLSAWVIYVYFKKKFDSPEKPLFDMNESIRLIVKLILYILYILFVLFIFVTVFYSKPLPAIYVLNYKPNDFKFSLDKPFFYSIDNTLRYGKTIEKKNPILFEEDFQNKKHYVYISPDNKKAALAIDKKLWLITLNKSPKLLLEDVNTQLYKNIGIGEKYFDNHTLQWAENSNSIYIIQYTKPKQIFQRNKHNKMIHIDLNTFTKKDVNIDRIFLGNYYFVGKDTICYSRAPGDGSVIWICLYKNEHINVKSHNKDKVLLENDVVLKGKPFLSRNLYGESTLSSYDFYGAYSKESFGFYSKQFGKEPILEINRSFDVLKGHTRNGIRYSRSVGLDQRYALLHVSYLDSKKLLLIDSQTGKYKELPNDIRVYRTFNPFNYKYFKLDYKNSLRFIPPRKFIE